VDITTVHHQSWYARKGDATPAGFESPVPIPFLTVRKGTRFAFCFLAPAEFELRPSLSSDKTKALNDFGVYPGKAPAAFLEDLLVSTSRYKGFGSQTAKGYGRMKRCK
jgi:CRISPR type III-B/RAMP module RAMP protein Cmr6